MLKGLQGFPFWSRRLSNAATQCSLILENIHNRAERWKKNIERVQYRERMKDLTSHLGQCLKQILKPFLFSFLCWRFGVIVCTVLTAIVLCLNISFAIWTLLNRGVEGGKHVIYEGKCASVSARMNCIQVFVTILSGLLLGASNYCMQILSAPTRAQIEEAQSKEMWLDIGWNSVRNVYFMSRKKKVLWMVVGASSVPIHSLFVGFCYTEGLSNDI